MPESSKNRAWILFGKLKPLAVLLALTTILTGCLGIGSTATVTDTGCLIFEPILYSLENDSERTVRQIRAHNNVWLSTCDDNAASK
jgi:hypothetical protein